MAIKILVLVGGISKDSLNKKLYRAMKKLAPSAVELEDFDISQLPYFSQDLENDPPEIPRHFKNKIKEAQAILFITPEYNRSFPGVLKNAIDWGSRPYGQNLWKKKIGGVLGASIGNIGTFGAQHHLRQSLSYLDMKVMGQPEFYLNGSKCFDDQGELKDDKVKKLIEDYWSAFVSWINEHQVESGDDSDRTG